MKLEVGKTYWNRKGEKIKIVDHNRSKHYPYWGNNNLSYSERGTYYIGLTLDEDLIKEVIERTPSQQSAYDKAQVMLAYAEGKEVVRTLKEGKLCFVSEPNIEKGEWDWYSYNYRVKEEDTIVVDGKEYDASQVKERLSSLAPIK